MSYDQENALVSELLHGLSQPATSLRCSIELALSRRQSQDEYRATLYSALNLADEIARYTNALREFLDSDSSLEPRTSFSLSGMLRETVEEFRPLANSANKKLVFASDDRCEIQVRPNRCHQAVFYLFEFLLAGIAEEGTIDMRLQTQGNAIHTSIQASRWSPPVSDGGYKARKRGLWQTLIFALAKRMFEAEGMVVCTTQGHDQFDLQLTIQSAPRN